MDRDAPWGAGEDSPLDEGSESAGLAPGRRAERRAGAAEGGAGAAGPGDGAAEPEPWAPGTGQHGFGTVEPSRIPAAGPGGAPTDSGPGRQVFPDDTTLDDLRNNPLAEETGMHSEGVSRHE